MVDLAKLNTTHTVCNTVYKTCVVLFTRTLHTFVHTLSYGMEDAHSGNITEQNITLIVGNYTLWDDNVIVCLFWLQWTIDILGIAGNILSLITLSSYKDHRGLELMLMYLAVVDLGLLTTDAVKLTCFSGPWVGGVNRKIAAVFHSIYMKSKAMSIYAVVYVSVERHIAICRPLYARHFCTLRKAKLAMLVITSVVFVYYLSRDVYFIYDVNEWQMSARFNMATVIIKRFVDPLLLSGIPLPLLFILNLQLIKAVVRSKKDGPRSNVTQNTLRPTLNVMGVLGLFSFTQTTHGSLFFYRKFATHVKRKDVVRIQRIRGICISLNSA